VANITELNISVVGQPFQLFTDASGVAVGSCLAQTDEQGVDHPVAYSSQKLTDVQTRWSTIERELYAIIVALLNCLILFNTVLCDHNPLTLLCHVIDRCVAAVETCGEGLCSGGLQAERR